MAKKESKKKQSNQIITAFYVRIYDCYLCRTPKYMNKEKTKMWCSCGVFDARINITKNGLWKKYNSNK